MKKLVRLLSLILCAVMLTSLLAGCGGKGSDGEEHPEYIYTPSYSDLALQLEYINASCVSDGRIYFAGQKANELPQPEPEAEPATSGAEAATATATDAYAYKENAFRQGIWSTKDDGTDPQELTAYTPASVPEGKQGSSSVNRLSGDGKGGLWVLETIYVYWYELPEGMSETDENAWDYYKSEDSYQLRRVDGTGAELANIDLSFMKAEGQEYFNVNNMVTDGSGNVFLSGSDGAIFVLDSNGSQLLTLKAEQGGWINSLIPLADGSVCAICYDQEGKGSLRGIDMTTKGFKTLSDSVPVNAWNFYAGAGDYDFYYNTSASFFGYDIETASSTNLVTWINADVDSNTLTTIVPMADGRILCVATDWKANAAKTELITMTRTPYQESDKTTLTFACMYLDWSIRSKIIDFNKKNENYHIEVQDYSQYNTESDYNAGMTKLNTEIIAGKVPDIIAVSGLPISQYAAKGLLEDLWPLIDADSALGGRDALVQPLFNALTQNDKLYQLCASFSITSTYALSSVVGDEPGWTLDEMNAALEKLNPGAHILSSTMTKSEWVSNVCSLYMGDLVNWETGECSFDSPLFIDLLKASDTMPVTFDYENYNWETDYVDPNVAMAQGDQLMNYFYLYSFQDVLYSLQGDASEFTFIGFPTADGSVGSIFAPETSLAMSSKCADKDGAWQFMRTFLTEDYQAENVWSMPSNQKALDAKLKEAMTRDYYTDENGEKVETPKASYMDQTGKQIEIYALEQAMADKLLELINGCTRLAAYDQNLTNIINEECAVFYAGDKTAEATASAIQSKVKLYINEQR